jgi:hypothetical protein
MDKDLIANLSLIETPRLKSILTLKAILDDRPQDQTSPLTSGGEVAKKSEQRAMTVGVLKRHIHDLVYSVQ